MIRSPISRPPTRQPTDGARRDLSSLALYHAPFPSALRRLANRVCTEPPAPLFESLCKAAVASHNTAALAYVFGFCTHYALSRVTYSFVSAQADRLSQFMPGYSAEARRHLVESDIDGVMIADFVSDTPAEYEAYRQLEPDAPESPLAAKILAQALRETYGVHITPAAVYHSMNDMRRMHHLAHQGASALIRLQRFEHLIGKSGFASSLIRPTESARGGLHQSGAHCPADIPHRRANGFILRFV